MIVFTRFSETSPSNACSNFSVPSVIVPVLSKQITSTRANVSIDGKACTSTFLRARFAAPTANATLVNNIRPSGIMLTNAATVPKTACLMDADAWY